jgi:uncharacterized protein (DUF58 family)
MKKRYLKVNIPQAIREFELAIRHQVITRIVGHYHSIFRGKGLEFDSYRPYTPADDASRIDWKASERSHQLLIKEYVEERDLKIFFLIDISSSMVFGSTPKLKNEFTLEMVAALANFILKSGDRVGFALFNEKVIKEVAPAGGNRQLHLLTRILLNPNIYAGNYNLDEVLKFLIEHLTDDTALIIIFSDFIGPRNWFRTLRILNQKIEVIGIMVSDPRDRTLPPTSQQIVLEDPYSGKTLLIDPSLIKGAYERYAKAQEEQIRNAFLEAEADFIKIPTEKSFVGPMVEFFKMRARKWKR